MEFALHLEKTVINLKIDALRLWNIALAGTACGNLLSLIEDAYGYPESKESILRGEYLETVEREFPENAPDAEPAAGLVSKEATDAEASGGRALPVKRRRLSQGPDKVKLKDATPIIPSTTVSLHQTGVSDKHVSERVGSQNQSVYHCMVSGCDYVTAQFAQCNTHVRRKHLGVCVQCRLCSRRSFRSVDIQKHLRDVHRDSENQWFEPTPQLEGDIIEVSADTLEANIALVKQEPVTPIEDEEDDEEED